MPEALLHNPILTMTLAHKVAATAGLIRMVFPLLGRYAIAHPDARSSHKVRQTSRYIATLST